MENSTLGPSAIVAQRNPVTRRPVIAIAGLSCETSTFTPISTQLDAFLPFRGNEILEKYTFLHTGAELGNAAEWYGALTAAALPNGVVTRDAFEELAGEIVSRLQVLVEQQPLDGLLFDIHGAMSVEGVEDSEAELLRRIRKVIGWEAAVSASMDLHGNVSYELVQQADLITCYRTAPHEDVVETKQRACRNLIDLLTQQRKRVGSGEESPAWPLKAWVHIPILLPGEMTSTRLEPAKGIYDMVPKLEATTGIIDVAVWVGYAWADEPRSHASVLLTGWDRDAVSRGVEQLANMFWEARNVFEFVAPAGSFHDCLSAALTSTARPYFISDSGDNPTAGGSGDVTWALDQILSWPQTSDPSMKVLHKVIYAALPAPAVVASAIEAGIGNDINVILRNESGGVQYPSIMMTGNVYAIRHGDPHAETEVVLESVCLGSIKLFTIFTKKRKPYHLAHDFVKLNLDITEGGEHSDAIVVVKIGYLEPELYNLAKNWMLALTPGGVDQDLVRLGHKKIARPMWPFDKHFDNEPDLRARFIGRG